MWVPNLKIDVSRRSSAVSLALQGHHQISLKGEQKLGLLGVLIPSCHLQEQLIIINRAVIILL